MKFNPPYKLIEAENREEFIELVNEAFRNGWRLGVGMSLADGEIRPNIYSLTLVRDVGRLN